MEFNFNERDYDKLEQHVQSSIETAQKRMKIAFAFWLGWVIFCGLLFMAVLFTAFHFIHKYW